MPNINIFFNEQELEALEFRMKTCGETAKSTHIKRVYFEGGKQDNAQLGRMQRQLDLLTDANEQMAKTLRHLMQMKVDSTTSIAQISFQLRECLKSIPRHQKYCPKEKGLKSPC